MAQLRRKLEGGRPYRAATGDDTSIYARGDAALRARPRDQRLRRAPRTLGVSWGRGHRSRRGRDRQVGAAGGGGSEGAFPRHVGPASDRRAVRGGPALRGSPPVAQYTDGGPWPTAGSAADRARVRVRNDRGRRP